ncbi:hypothetical protein [Actinoplanes italicus]|nr:hypothetical protein [Actinoplanes italicus]
MDPAAGVLERGDLLIENGLVAALESAAERLGPVPRSALGPAS